MAGLYADGVELTVATCQFPVGADIGRNARYVMDQMRSARAGRADVAHFPEACLSGYAGSDLGSFAGYDWAALKGQTERIVELAGELGLWVVLGSAHPLSAPHKPHNSLYIISAAGAVIDRYDKRFCSGGPGGGTGDLAHYSPGDHFSVFEICGVRCGTLICYDYRFPELYRAYKSAGVQVMFHSFHAAHVDGEHLAEMRAAVGLQWQKLNPGGTYPGITMPATMTAAAAGNYMWVSCPNSSARYSCWPSFFVRADGVTTGRLRRHRAGVLISRVGTDEDLYDSTVAWRERAMAGQLHSGELVRDPRSEVRTEL